MDHSRSTFWQPQPGMLPPLRRVTTAAAGAASLPEAQASWRGRGGVWGREGLGKHAKHAARQDSLLAKALRTASAPSREGPPPTPPHPRTTAAAKPASSPPPPPGHRPCMQASPGERGGKRQQRQRQPLQQHAVLLVGFHPEEVELIERNLPAKLQVGQLAGRLGATGPWWIGVGRAACAHATLRAAAEQSGCTHTHTHTHSDLPGA